MARSRDRVAPGSPTARAAGTSDPLEGLLARIEDMGIDELRSLWRKRYRKRLPDVASADLLRRLLAWRLQVEAHGDLDRETHVRLRALMRADGRRKAGNGETLPLVSLRPGTVLVREVRGVVHRVLVLVDGFEYRDRRFGSLTAVARHIAGSRVSGPRFFGLKAWQLKKTLGGTA